MTRPPRPPALPAECAQGARGPDRPCDGIGPLAGSPASGRPLARRCPVGPHSPTPAHAWERAAASRVPPRAPGQSGGPERWFWAAWPSERPVPLTPCAASARVWGQGRARPVPSGDAWASVHVPRRCAPTTRDLLSVRWRGNPAPGQVPAPWAGPSGPRHVCGLACQCRRLRREGPARKGRVLESRGHVAGKRTQHPRGGRRNGGDTGWPSDAE